MCLVSPLHKPQGAIDIVGFVVEATSGMKLGEFLEKYILSPCGVSGEITYESISSIHSSLIHPPRFEPTNDMRRRLMGSHFRWPDGTERITPRPPVYSDNVKEHLGGVGAYGTTKAFAQVALPLINGGVHRVFLYSPQPTVIR
jgi:hypothetical protein